MNQSTIYRRHEARLQRTYALKDDPRPAVIRVLSGLPGFRVFVPPYQPTQTTVTLQSLPEIKSPSSDSTFSQDTVFITHGAFDNKTQSTTTAPITETTFPSSAVIVAAVLGGSISLARHQHYSHHSLWKHSTVLKGSMSPFAAVQQPGGLLMSLIVHPQRWLVAPKSSVAAAAVLTLRWLGSKRHE